MAVRWDMRSQPVASNCKLNPTLLSPLGSLGVWVLPSCPCWLRASSNAPGLDLSLELKQHALVCHWHTLKLKFGTRPVLVPDSPDQSACPGT